MHRNAAHASVITGPWQSSAPTAATPRRPERRKAAPLQNADALRAGLTPAQLVTLEALEIFQWRLAFVRRPLFQAPIPVLFDRDSKAMGAWPVKGLPTTFLVDRQGRLALKAVGGREFDDSEIVAIINEMS